MSQENRRGILKHSAVVAETKKIMSQAAEDETAAVRVSSSSSVKSKENASNLPDRSKSKDSSKRKPFSCRVAIFDEIEDPNKKTMYPKRLVYAGGKDIQLEEVRAMHYWNKVKGSVGNACTCQTTKTYREMSSQTDPEPEDSIQVVEMESDARHSTTTSSNNPGQSQSQVSLSNRQSIEKVEVETSPSSRQSSSSNGSTDTTVILAAGKTESAAVNGSSTRENNTENTKPNEQNATVVLAGSNAEEATAISKVKLNQETFVVAKPSSIKCANKTVVLSSPFKAALPNVSSTTETNSNIEHQPGCCDLPNEAEDSNKLTECHAQDEPIASSVCGNKTVNLSRPFEAALPNIPSKNGADSDVAPQPELRDLSNEPEDSNKSAECLAEDEPVASSVQPTRTLTTRRASRARAAKSNQESLRMFTSRTATRSATRVKSVSKIPSSVTKPKSVKTIVEELIVNLPSPTPQPFVTVNEKKDRIDTPSPVNLEKFYSGRSDGERLAEDQIEDNTLNTVAMKFESVPTSTPTDDTTGTTPLQTDQKKNKKKRRANKYFN